MNATIFGSIIGSLTLVVSLSMGSEVFVVEHSKDVTYDPNNEYSYQTKMVTRSVRSADGNESNATIEVVQKEKIRPQLIPYVFRTNDDNGSDEIDTDILLMPTKVSDEDMENIGDEIGYRESQTDDNTSIEAMPSAIRRAPTRTDISRRTLPVSGRLYFKHKGKPRSCSASLVDSPDILVTAGHCLLNYGVTHTNIQYFPSPQTSKKYYRAKAFFIPSKWRNGSNFDYDFGIIKLTSPVGGRTISLSSVYNPPKKAKVTAYGYPGGAILFQAPGIYQYNGRLLYMLNSMGSGSSGGPWIDAIGRVAGVNSFHYVDNPNIMYSPYFSSAFNRLLNQAKAYH